MKKTTEKKEGTPKQWLTATVYTALAVTVVAVSVNGITASFSKDKKDIEENSGQGSLYGTDYIVNPPEKIVLPELDYDKQVSDIKQGVNAQITQKENKVQEDKNAPSTQENNTPSDIKNSIFSNDNTENKEPNNDMGQNTLQIVESDKSKPYPEEPSEPTFEYGYTGFIKPCQGYVSKEFSLEVPVYSATMYDYRTHSGVDIACDIGTPVKAVTNGEIKEVYDDYFYGTTVVIEHADGVCSVYSNLSPDLPVDTVAGRSVITGDIIAGVGQSALCESAEVSHLHFEMRKENESVNPGLYIEGY